MKTILASVYAINPFKGSEDGTGWNLVLQIARYNKVIAVTRRNNRPHIEEYLLQHAIPESANMQFVYYDLPYWARWWKRGPRGALLYYYLWQIFLPGFVKRKKLDFDITHNLNFHSDWTPSFLWRFGKPFVWGPVGHHPVIPRQFIQPVYGQKKWLADRLRWRAKQLFWHIDPFLRRTRNKADYILAINSDVNKQLRVDPRKLMLMPAVATDDMRIGGTDAGCFTVISVGRFVALKGFDITIRAFARFTNRLPADQRAHARLVLVGNGPELAFLQQMIEDLGIAGLVEIVLWTEREALKMRYSDANVFFFPSHEGAGMVVPEALSCGLPVLCFDNAGPGEFITADCGIKIPCRSYEQSVDDFANALQKLNEDAALLSRLSEGARRKFETDFQWNKKGDALKHIYDQFP